LTSNDDDDDRGLGSEGHSDYFCPAIVVRRQFNVACRKTQKKAGHAYQRFSSISSYIFFRVEVKWDEHEIEKPSALP
jgi:hypothetical protein